MQTVLKALLGIFLALGFLILDAKAASQRPKLAFLGLGADSDPLFHDELTRRIRRDLSADTALSSLPASEIARLTAIGAPTGPEISSFDLPALAPLGAQYYAFGWLEPVDLQVKRKWLKPWDVNIRWSQGLRLRVIDAETGLPVFDGVVPAEIAEKGFILAPDAPSSRMSPLDRDRCLRRMLPVLSSECAKTLSKVIKERADSHRPASAGEPAASAGEPAAK
jgi:hypothetical protein